MPANPLMAYENVSKAAMSGRELEAAVLTKAAQRLKRCQDTWNEEGAGEKLDEALRYNQKLWTHFQGQLTDPENPLPPLIKQNLLNLSVFVDRRTFELMADPSAEKLTPLININQIGRASCRERECHRV